MRSFRASMAKCQKGSTIIEFAIVAPVLFLILFGVFEFAFIVFATIVIESATDIATRTSRIGNLDDINDFKAHIRDVIEEKSFGLINYDRVVITTDTSADYENLNKLPEPETCIKSEGRECVQWIDTNGNGIYDDGASLALGGGGERIEFRVLYPWTIQFPFMGDFIGDNGEYIITASSIVQNEPE